MDNEEVKNEDAADLLTVLDGRNKFRDASLDTTQHEVGRLVAGGLAAFVAEKAASKLYDVAVLAIRARRNK